MSGSFPTTHFSFLSRLRERDNTGEWQVSWKRFLELYRVPLSVAARGIYRKHSGGMAAPEALVEDVVARVVVDFSSKGIVRYDCSKGRLRTFLRFLVNTRVIDMLRSGRSAARIGELIAADDVPEETPEDVAAFREALAATLIEELRGCIAHRQFEIFEMIKLKGLSPEEVAEDLGVRRGVIDNSVYKAMKKLREIAQRTEYKEEYYA